MLAKVPPHSVEAERGVLGSILIDKDGIIQVSGLLSPGDFYDNAHALVYETMLTLFSANRPIDLLTVREHLDDRGKLDAVGGNSYLLELSNSIFTSSNIYQYGQIVKSKSVLRRLIKAGSDILSYGYDEENDINVLLEKSEQALFTVTQTFIQNKLVHIKDIVNLRYEEFAEIHEDPNYGKEGAVYTGFS